MRAAEAGAGLAAAWTGAEGWAVTAGGGHGLCGGALSCGMEGEAPAASAPADAVERCCVAYERALLPCASDRSLWLEYALHLETAGRVAAARGVLQRATGRFFTACVPTLLAHAAFEEEHGGESASVLWPAGMRLGVRARGSGMASRRSCGEGLRVGGVKGVRGRGAASGVLS